MGPHSVVLKNDADIPPLHRHVDPAAGAENAVVAYIDLSRFRLIEAQQTTNQGGLAAAGGSNQTQDLAAFDVQAEILQYLVGAVLEGDVLK